MGIFDIFRKNKEISLDELKWNKMWELWVNDEIDSPYKELMMYQSEIGNGGHSQYFSNIHSIRKIKKEMTVLHKILPDDFIINLNTAYEAYLILEKNDDENALRIIEMCDNFYYDNEDEINLILEEYASKIEI